MQFLDGSLIVSPSDLTGFLECEHLTQQELAAARGEIERPERKDPELEVLTRRGLEHEARHLASLRTGHRRVVEFPFPDGTEEEPRLKDYAAYYRSVKRQFEQVVFPSPSGEGQGGGTYPDPVDHCRICRWIDVCEARRRKDDHLCLVAGMRRDQTRRLNLAGIKTVTELGASPIDQAIHGINEMALIRLRQQARLQVQQRHSDTLPFEVLPPLGEHLGFQALPAPTPDDLFFDMEGDPFVGDNGIEYLFGIWEGEEEERVHHKFWGHDPDEEKRAFEQGVDFLIERLNRN